VAQEVNVLGSVWRHIRKSRKILGGLGHIEEYTLERTSGATEGVCVRLFDPRTQQWSVYEADAGGGFDPRPVIGAFKDKRLEGYAYQSGRVSTFFVV
jgi:hypothetical protein